MESEPTRLRPPPSERFAGPVHQFDLAGAARKLREEVRAGHSNHRQESLYKSGPTTIALFLFAPGAGLATHRTHGTVFIQILRGRMTVTAANTPHDLAAGGLLVLAPDVPHELHAHEESEMLLTVQLTPP